MDDMAFTQMASGMAAGILSNPGANNKLSG
jgi:hypothetical protein